MSEKKPKKNFAKGNIARAYKGFVLSFVYGGSPANSFGGKTINQVIGVPTVPLDQIIKAAVERSNAAQ